MKSPEAETLVKDPGMRKIHICLKIFGNDSNRMNMNYLT